MSEQKVNKANEISEISTIREIIFGDNMRHYQHKFEETQALINTNRADAEAQLNDTNNQLLTALQNLEERLSAQIKKNHEETIAEMKRLDDAKVNRKQLGGMLANIGKLIDG